MGPGAHVLAQQPDVTTEGTLPRQRRFGRSKAPSCLGPASALARPSMLALRPLPVPVETTEEGADYPPIVDSPPGLPGRKNLLPLSSTAELFREFQHFGLRTLKSSHRAGARPTKPTITLPQGCTIIAQDRIVVDRQLAQ